MNKKKFLFLLFYFLSSLAFTCPTDIPKSIYYIEKNSNYKNIEKCTEVISLKSFLKNTLNIPKNQVLQNLNLANGLESVELEENEILEVECKNCHKLGNINLSLTIKNLDSNKERKIWGQGKLLQKAQALVAKKQLGPMTPSLSKTDFEMKTIETLSPEKLFLDIENLPFYSLNQTLPQNAPLEILQLRKINLVNHGSLIHVMVENGSIILKKEAQALNLGKLGEKIQLKERNTGKIFTATVIDFNKAYIKL